ncbi:IclR family transcriptional regulator [Paenarthrobacter nitroguajacolicus]|uniref:IclR family transcriptional regulator n=1 Tax=Paenarthrobacter nitroguajacolicus TaxID=211146 RepID=UPI004053CB2C
MPGYFLKTLANGIDVLQLLKDGPLTQEQIAGSLHLPADVAYRIVRTFQDKGFISRQPDGTVALTLAVWELGMSARTSRDVRLAVSHQVSHLMESFGETVHLSVYDSGDVVYIDKWDGTKPLRSYTRLGGRSPAYCVATGKALLAFQPAEEIQRLLRSGLKRHTARTVVNPDLLRIQLTSIHRGAISVNTGELNCEVGGLAVPLRAATGVVAALGLSGPAERMLANRPDYERALWQAAHQIEEELGIRST